MKKIILLITLGIFSLSLIPQAKADKREVRREVKVALTPKTLSMVEKDGAINVQFLITIPPHYVKSSRQYLFTPVLTDLTNVYALPSVIVEGERYQKMVAKNGHSKYMKEKWESAPDLSDAVRLLATKNGRTINYEALIPFEPWMERAKMVTIQRFNTKKETTLIAEDIYGSRVKITPKPKIITEKVRKVHYLEGDIKVDFLISSSKLDPTLDKNKEELDRLKTMINKIIEQPNAKLDSICITASSSPDGAYEFNKKLSFSRAETIRNYIISNFHDSLMMSNLVHTNYIAENWTGLDRYVMRSNITNKKEVMQAITIENIKEREMAMKALPQYGYIKKYILPKLRFVKYQIFYHTDTIQSVVIMPQGENMTQKPSINREQKGGCVLVPQRDKVKDKILPRYIRYHR